MGTCPTPHKTRTAKQEMTKFQLPPLAPLRLWATDSCMFPPGHTQPAAPQPEGEGVTSETAPVRAGFMAHATPSSRSCTRPPARSTTRPSLSLTASQRRYVVRAVLPRQRLPVVGRTSGGVHTGHAAIDRPCFVGSTGC